MSRNRKSWIDLLNEFYVYNEAEPLSPKAVSLYMYILYRFNRAYWREPICIRMTTLADATAQSYRSAINARAELVGAGFLWYESRGGSASACYTLPNLYRESDKNESGRS